MILNTITLHNFMSYADTQLDLSLVPVSCLAGANGAGKSALLDAITWAIWEEARSSSDDLVRLGEREMWADVRFEHEGESYRIRRSHLRAPGKNGSRGQSKGTLDFQVGNNGGQSWKSLTGASKRETQKLICDLLRMEYDTFVNSAYLKQGRADEFTTRTAKDRKQVLADILGLSYFDRLQEHCREHLRSLKQKKEWLEQVLMELPVAKEQLIALQSEHLAKQEELALCFKEKLARDKAADQLRDQLKRMAFIKDRLEASQLQLKQDQEDIDILTSQVAELNQRLSVLKELIDDRSRIEKEADRYEKLRLDNEKLDQSALLLQELTRRKIEARAELANLRNRLELEVDQAKEKLTKALAEMERLRQDTADSAKLAQEYQEYRALVAKEEELARKQEAFIQITDRCARLKQQIDEARVHLEADLAQKTAALADLNALLTSGQSLPQQKKNLEKQVQDLDKLETELELTRERGQETRGTLESIALKIENLKVTKIDNHEKIKELQACANSSICPLCSAPIVDRAAVIKRYQELINDTDSQINQLEEEFSQKEQQRILLRQQYKTLDERLKGRKNLDIEIGRYNEKLAAIKRAEENKARTEAEVNTLNLRLQTNDYAQVEQESLIALNNELAKLDFDPVFYNGVQGQVRLDRAIEPRYHQMIRDLDGKANLEIQIPLLQRSFEELGNKLAEESYGKELRTLLAETEKSIDELDYDGAKHSSLKAKLSELLPLSEKHKDLKRALEESSVLKSSHQNNQLRLNTKLEQIAALKKELSAWQSELAQAPLLEEELKQKEKLTEEAAFEYESLSKQVAVLDAQKIQLTEKLAHLEESRQSLSESERTISDYAFLSEAFGKKGIQAVIIENAIPEIEADANRILSRLSDNRMHVGLVTQQTNKSGNLVETLEIFIADEIGTRSYELYSGGEAFKVNFAIRVALSRLLARRAGAKLETLIIDEGFGSQDDTSRERLVKAIRSIQDDFARILVITHFADVKEMFPSHILVSKTNGTSKVELLS
ncbi:MAG: hypothetical protein C5B53_02190 [Candidatus Melainabacteria bacterium]|nr:MAG: hypothetical protein C5B53_02190 [Candidatus Melainabacteria bacterium]